MQRVRICAHMRAHHLGINQGLAAGGRPSLVIAWLQGHVCRCTCRAILGHEKGIHLRVGVRCGESQMRACDWPYLRTSKHIFSVPLLILSTCTHTHTHTLLQHGASPPLDGSPRQQLRHLSPAHSQRTDSEMFCPAHAPAVKISRVHNTHGKEDTPQHQYLALAS